MPQNVAQALNVPVRPGLYAEMFPVYKSGIDKILSPATISGNRAVLRDAFADILRAYGFDSVTVDNVIRTMRTSKGFGFRTLDQNGVPVPFESLYDLLSNDAGDAKPNVSDFLKAYFGSLDTPAASAAAVNLHLKRLIFRLGLNSATQITKDRWGRLLSSMYGVPLTTIALLISGTAAEPDDATGPPAPEPGPASATAPRADGGATMTPVATPQFTDPPATASLESAMSQLADRTLSVQQITRSMAPDRYQWWMIKARRRTLRNLFFAVFTGLGATPQDSTQVLNFMDPTFVDVSLNTQQYSGLRIQGRHGSYPRLDAFFLKYFNTFSKYFAGLSSAIRVSYASTIATRIFGSRGKSYFQKLFALSNAELAQVAKNSVAVLDIVTGDTTFSDEFPEGPAPTAAEARGYQTGPIDYFGPP
jgi:hypothetical protein